MAKRIPCEVHCVLGSDPVGLKGVFNMRAAEEGNDDGTGSFREGSDLEKSKQIEYWGGDVLTSSFMFPHTLR